LTTFDEDTALTPSHDGAYAGEINPDWWVGRGPLGGYVMAIALRGMLLAVGDPSRQPRTMTMHFVRAPEAGPITVTPTVERAGRSVSFVTARMEQGGKLVGLAMGAFGGPWESPRYDDLPMPDVEPAGPRVPATPPFEGPPVPFTQRLTMQHRFGPPPFSSGEHALVGGWYALLEDRPLDALAVVMLADAWFPTPFPMLSGPALAPTVELTVHFRAPLPLDDTVVLGRFHSAQVRDGFFDEDGAIWTPDGTLVAQSRQLALLIGAPAD
jgi:acyl-CoA thioesterase